MKSIDKEVAILTSMWREVYRNVFDEDLCETFHDYKPIEETYYERV